MSKMTVEEAFKVFSHKGPVNIKGAELAANAAWAVIEPHLYDDEKTKISIALSNAKDSGEGRCEFDDVMRCIGVRLNFGTKF